MKRVYWFVIIGICLIGSSCALNNTAHRRRSMGDGAKTIAVDAKQRFLITTNETRNVTPKPENGGTTSETLRQFCLEPSPDVFSVLSASMEGSVKYQDKASADFKAALSEAAATIGIRTETIQLLRDAMYRVCELGLNGKLDAKDAFDLHQHYQKSMVTLAAVSALADSTRPTQVGIGSRATITRGALMTELTKQIEETQKDKATQVEAQKSAGDSLAAAYKKLSEAKVKKDSCKPGADKCVLGEGDTTLPDAPVGDANEKATTDEAKKNRADGCCTNETNKTNELCMALAKAKVEVDSASTNLKNTEDSLKKLQDDLDATKKNSDLGAMTEIVRLAPTTVQPSNANVKEVADVVRTLVTQVYASDFVKECIEALTESRSLAAKVTEADERGPTLESDLLARGALLDKLKRAKSEAELKRDGFDLGTSAGIEKVVDEVPNLDEATKRNLTQSLTSGTPKKKRTVLVDTITEVQRKDRELLTAKERLEKLEPIVEFCENVGGSFRSGVGIPAAVKK